jgi:hypothetical protein
MLERTYARLDKALTRAQRRRGVRCKQGVLTEISTHTGLSIDWLRKFEGRRIHDPGSLKVETLHNYLGEIERDATLKPG